TEEEVILYDATAGSWEQVARIDLFPSNTGSAVEMPAEDESTENTYRNMEASRP
ncbi:unnamed protein product, partial [Amoebophrya sp. A120]